jgi:hypothetical protein
VEKVIVTTAEALRLVNDPSAGPPPARATERWKFVKNFGAAEAVKFRDGSEYRFRLIRSNGPGEGYLPGSQMETDDEGLAQKLREAMENPATGLVEITI